MFWGYLPPVMSAVSGMHREGDRAYGQARLDGLAHQTEPQMVLLHRLGAFWVCWPTKPQCTT
jgi:hypothetical protein